MPSISCMPSKSEDPGLLIRPALEADIETLVQFNRAMALETEGKSLAEAVVTSGIQRLLAAPQSGFYLVAQVGSRVVACLMVTFEWSDWRDGNFWWIQSVYVAPDARRQGIFSCLFEHVRQLAARDPNVCGLRLYVEHGNTQAQETYRALGMRCTTYAMFELGVSDASEIRR